MSDQRDEAGDPQPLPTAGDGRDVTEAVIEDLRGRREMGTRKYQTFLQPFNGRDALRDHYDEACDGLVYLKQFIMEGTARMMTDDEHLLTCLAEECAEISEQCSRIAVRVSKILRFGLDEVQPGQLRANVERLTIELGDILAVAEKLERAGVIKRSDVERKDLKLDKFMEYARQCGTLDREAAQ